MQVFLDVDGVIADFFRGALAEHGMIDMAARWPVGEREMPNVLGMTEDQFWHTIGKNKYFWEDLAPYHWLDELVSEAKAIGEVRLLTTPCRSPECYSGKYTWTRRFVPGLEVIMCHSKQLLARPGRILVDDYEKNVDGWRANGGLAVLFPAIWNRAHAAADDPMAAVRRELARHAGGVAA